jgi:heme exporter protein D
MKLDYVGGAYLVFGLVLAWDYLSPRLRLGRVRRAIALRLRRAAARSAA